MSATPENCPCAAVVELKEVVKELQHTTAAHEARLAEGNTNFALIKQDLEYIKGSLDGKKRFNAGIIQTIINCIITIALGYFAIRAGLQ